MFVTSEHGVFVDRDGIFGDVRVQGSCPIFGDAEHQNVVDHDLFQ